MRTIVFALAGLACICHSRRVQTRVPADEPRTEEVARNQSGNLVDLDFVVEVNDNVVLGIEAITESLKYDVANIFLREPHWNNFEQYFTVTDRSTGGALFGLSSSKKITKLLRLIYKKFSVKQFKVDFIDINWIETTWKDERLKDEARSSDGSVIALFSVELARKSSGSLKNSIVIEGQAKFHVSNTHKVARAEVLSIYVDGFQLLPMLWPDVDFDQESHHQTSIDEWLQKMCASTEQALKGRASELVLKNIGMLPDSGIDKSLQTLKADFAKILRKEPNWNTFAHNLTLVDQTGATVVGLELNKLLAKLLRRLPQKFLFKDFSVTFVERHVMIASWQDGKLKGKIQEPFEPYVMAIWQLDINTRGSRLWSRDPPLKLQANTIFTLDAERSKIATVQITNILINEWDLIQWPDVDVTEQAEFSMEYIEQWIQDIKSQLENPEEIRREEYDSKAVQDWLSEVASDYPSELESDYESDNQLPEPENNDE